MLKIKTTTTTGDINVGCTTREMSEMRPWVMLDSCRLYWATTVCLQCEFTHLPHII